MIAHPIVHGSTLLLPDLLGDESLGAALVSLVAKARGFLDLAGY